MLTPRERRALQGLAEGERVWETAQAMQVGENAVYGFRRAVYRKLGLEGKGRKARAIWMYLTGEAFLRRGR
jgi:DNA-binding CsgD family transcriptional regulator